MSNSIITAEAVSKKYRIKPNKKNTITPSYSTLRDTLAETTKSLLSKYKQQSTPQFAQEDFWALKNINFTIEQGSTTGVIGRNGAGKSTLLKLLSRITEPTEGRIILGGRIASLLEVGTGFHPELTGRENIYLNGSILGMKHSEIRMKFDEIVDFSGIEPFLNTPVKRYSSGMWARLGFAISAHLQSDILIVDEVLSVGDQAFQQKCLDKMQQLSTSKGCTILFVSHNVSALKTICQNGILLEKGELVCQGDINTVLEAYS